MQLQQSLHIPLLSRKKIDLAWVWIKQDFILTVPLFCRVSCVKGRYPSKLLNEWNAFHEEKGSENDNPGTLNEFLVKSMNKNVPQVFYRTLPYWKKHTEKFIITTSMFLWIAYVAYCIRNIISEKKRYCLKEDTMLNTMF